MKPSEIRGKSGEELQKELEGLLRAQFGLRMQLATQQLNNTSQLKKVKRDIARVRTIMKEKAAKWAQRQRNRQPRQRTSASWSAAWSATRCKRRWWCESSAG
jgi:large subunit ribosomal protein L29